MRHKRLGREHFLKTSNAETAKIIAAGLMFVLAVCSPVLLDVSLTFEKEKGQALLRFNLYKKQTFEEVFRKAELNCLKQKRENDEC